MQKTKLTLVTSGIVYIEWVEYALYMYLGTTISHFIFPEDLGQYSLLLTYGIFAIAYLSRPVGGLLFGLMADRKGRRKPLIYSSLLVGLATIGIGLLPGYATIGIASPILLLVCRLIQSIAVSGEFNNSSIFLIEHAARYKTLAGSWVGTASSAGMFSGGLIAYLLSLSSYPHSWRFAFILVGVASLIIMLMRKSLEETPDYIHYRQQARAVQPPSFRKLAYHHREGLLRIAIIAAFLSIYIYTCNVYFVSYMIAGLGYSISFATGHMMLVQGLVTVLIPLFALLADRLGYARVLRRSIPVIALMALIQFYGAKTHSYPLILTGLALYILANAAISATIFRYMFEALPVEIRCSGSSLVYSLAAAIFGGTAPLLAATLIDNGWSMAPAWYVLGFALLSYLSVKGLLGKLLFTQENYRPSSSR
ncbi:MFS transporter [Dongshaea marina]|uniref:MFS transporter n=1 Tax=Dongshaea marina TaxID=2047966 RepID=UPI000D3E9B11|nr:MFS transporter [Dongshaea marina]